MAYSQNPNKENTRKELYIEGDETTDGSKRFAIDSETGYAEVEARISGIWQPATLEVGSNTLWVGHNVGVGAVGHHLVTEAADGHLHFHAHSEYDGAATIDVKVINALSHTDHMPVVPDESGEWTGTIYNYTYPSADHRIFKNVYFKTGTTAVTSPVTINVWEGTDDTGNEIFHQTYPISDFPVGQEVKISAAGYLEFDRDVTYYVRLESANTFSLKTTADLVYPYTYGDVTIVEENSILQTDPYIDGNTFTDGQYLIKNRKIYVCNTTGVQEGTWESNSALWDMIDYQDASSYGVSDLTGMTQYNVPFGVADGSLTQDNNFTYNGSALSIPEIYNSAGDLKIQPDVQGDVVLFGDTDVANNEGSKEIIGWRRAPEGNDYWRIYITNDRKTMFHSSTDMTFQGQSSFIINSVDDNIFLKLGDSAGAKEVRVRDKSGLDVSTIDSNGNAWYRGDVAIGVDSDVLIQANGVSYFNGGNVGIGTNDPEYLFNLLSSDPIIKLESSRTIMGQGYNVGALVFSAGESYHSEVAQIRVDATESWTDTSSPTAFEFRVTPVDAIHSTSRVMRIISAGVGIHRSEIIQLPLEVESADDNQIMCIDSSSQAEGVGGGIAFGAHYTDAGDETMAARIEAEKSDGVSGNWGFDLAIETQDSGGSLIERMKFTSDGKCGINVTAFSSPTKPLDVFGDTRIRGELGTDNGIIVGGNIQVDGTVNGTILNEDGNFNMFIGEDIPNNIGGSNISIGSGNMTSVTANDAHYNILIGTNLASTLEGNSDANLLIGHSIMTSLTLATDHNIILGYNLPMSDCENASDNTVIGHHSCDDVSTFTENVVFGCNTVRSATNMMQCTIIGKSAGNLATGTMDNVILLGYGTTCPASTFDNYMNLGNTIRADTENRYVVIGGSSAKPSGPEMLWVEGALKVDDEINGLILYGNTTYHNIGIDTTIPLDSDVFDNIFIGYDTGGTLTEGADNIIIGCHSASNFADQYTNIIIGNYAGTSASTGHDNILIGDHTEIITGTVDNCLNIGNLIFGKGTPSQVRIGGGISDALETSAALEIRSTDGALLLPRMTTTQRNALTPINGMLIYNTSTNKFQGRENGAWVNLN